MLKCNYAIGLVWEHFNDDKLLKELAFDKENKPNQMLESTIALLFLTLITLDGFLDDESLEKNVFDSMHEAFYKGLDVDKRNRSEIKKIFALRYKEYQKAMKEKRGPNWLWPLTHHVLNNLKREETKDAFAMTGLTVFLTSVVKQIPGLVDNYEIIRNMKNKA